MLFLRSLVFMGQSQSSMPCFNWYVSIDSNRYVFVQKVTIFLMRWQLLAVFWYAERFTEPKCLASTLDRQNLRQLLRQKVSKSTRQKVWQVSWQKFKFNCCVENVAMISFCFYLKVRIWISPPSSALNLMLVFEISSYYAVLI